MCLCRMLDLFFFSSCKFKTNLEAHKNRKRSKHGTHHANYITPRIPSPIRPYAPTYVDHKQDYITTSPLVPFTAPLFHALRLLIRSHVFFGLGSGLPVRVSTGCMLLSLDPCPLQSPAPVPIALAPLIYASPSVAGNPSPLRATTGSPTLSPCFEYCANLRLPKIAFSENISQTEIRR